MIVTERARTAATWVAAALLAVICVLAIFWDRVGASSTAPTPPGAAQPFAQAVESDAVPLETPPPPSHSLPPSATPSAATSLTRPDAARGVTVPAAAKFARWYFEQVVNHAKRTGDVVPIRAASDLDCAPCTKNVTAWSRGNQANGLLTGDHQWRSSDVIRAQLTGKATAEVDLKLSIGAFTYRAAPRAKPDVFPAHTIALRLWLTARGDNWVMYDWERLVL